MKVALLNDTHFGAKSDSISFLRYFRLFYDKVFFPKLEELQIKTVMHLGDFYDRRKYINTFTASQAREMLLDRLEKYDVHILAGNHDCFYKHTNQINSLHEFIRPSPSRHIYENPCTIDVHGVLLFLVPWITTDNQALFEHELSTTKADILLGHLELSGFEMHRGSFSDHGLSKELFRSFSLVASGHFHHKSCYQNINYLGSPYEMTWADYNDPKGFHILDLETKELEFISNPYRLFHKVFYDDSKTMPQETFDHLQGCYVKVVVVNKGKPHLYDEYIDKIEAAEPAHIQIIEDHLKLSIGDDREVFSEVESTEEILKKAIRQLDIDYAKEKEVTALLTSVYHEASQGTV